MPTAKEIHARLDVVTEDVWRLVARELRHAAAIKMALVLDRDPGSKSRQQLGHTARLLEGVADLIQSDEREESTADTDNLHCTILGHY